MSLSPGLCMLLEAAFCAWYRFDCLIVLLRPLFLERGLRRHLKLEIDLREEFFNDLLRSVPGT